MDRVEFVTEFGRRYQEIAACDRAYHIAEPNSSDRQRSRSEATRLVDETLAYLLDLFPLDQEYKKTVTFDHIQQCFAMSHHDIFMQALLVIDKPLIPVLVMRHFIGTMAMHITMPDVKSFPRFCDRYRDLILLT